MMTAAGAAALLAGPVVAGLVGSPHCVGMCGGFAMAAGATGWRGQAAWTIGRLGTYATLGAIAGALGEALPGPGWVGTALAAVFLVAFSLKLAGVSPTSGGPALRGVIRAASTVAGRTDLLGRLAFGGLTGLLPCGLVYAALAFPLASGSAALGALTMVAFGLGTTPALSVAAVGLRTLASRSLRTRRLVAAAVLVLGLAGLGLRSAPSLAHPHPSPTAEAP